jgi:predicted transcriptional regulator
MDALKIAELKDNILKYLAAAQNKKVLLLDMYRDLKPKNIPISVVKDYMEDMAQDGEIFKFSLSGGRDLYSIAEEGERRLREGGYTKQMEEEIQVKEQQKVDSDTYRYKTDLEIKHLKASMEHYKDSKTWAIIAIIISIITLFYSMFLK